MTANHTVLTAFMATQKRVCVFVCVHARVCECKFEYDCEGTHLDLVM